MTTIFLLDGYRQRQFRWIYFSYFGQSSSLNAQALNIKCLKKNSVFLKT